YLRRGRSAKEDNGQQGDDKFLHTAKITIYNARASCPPDIAPPAGNPPAACPASARQRVRRDTRAGGTAEVGWAIRTGRPIQYGSSDGKYRPYANRLSEPAAEELRLGAVFHQVGLDEGIQVAVHHRLDSRGLHARAMVFHTPVVEDIGADLRSPLDLLLRSLERLLRGHAFIQFPLVELRAEDAHGILAVHQL